MAHTPSKKKSKDSIGQTISLLRGSERSSIVLDEDDQQSWKGKEMWLVQVPANVCKIQQRMYIKIALTESNVLQFYYCVSVSEKSAYVAKKTIY